MGVPNYGSGWHIPGVSSDAQAGAGGGDAMDNFAAFPTEGVYTNAQYDPNAVPADPNSFTFDNSFENFSPGYENAQYNGISDYTSGGIAPNYVPTSSDVNALYGEQGYGENPSSSGGSDLLKKYQNAVSPFQGFLKNPIISTLMSLNPYTALAKTVLSGPQSMGGFLGSLFSSNPIGRMAGSLAGGQLANYATNGEFAPMSGQNIGSMLGGLAGGLSGLPYGGMAGSYLGGQLGGLEPGSFGGNSGNSYGTSSMGPSASGFMPGEYGGQPMGMGNSPNLQGVDSNNGLLGGLVGLGLGMNNNRMLGQQIGNLQGLYGQNSPYATALRQQLERRDAAAGRRSQYGPREVELQAALAGNAARLAPSLQQLYSQKMGNTNLAAATLMNNLMKNPNMFSGLSGLFSGRPDVAPVGNLPDVPNYNPVTLPDVSNGGFQSGNEGMGD